ncbi:ADP-ribose-binding protein [Geobacter pelophilus]|uniref:ADP-ribose-binding protein n=1 Tax=Geoanaerobacter pelophilus TaxID=60036 RepID=A0AAW4L4X4_9BACT|nr:ADP-ribose-binding protein [Geoanaerobacter pelophilus]MBT0665938.1 ADP-ribose-binding protein [Geoanaerobacter pelophilus]
MVELTGNIWDYWGKAIIVVTTNGSLTRDGRAILGRGVARQALEYCPDLAYRLGMLLKAHGNHVTDLGNNLASFPVEETAWSLPDMQLIVRSALELRQLADSKGWRQVVVPRPGCGGGGLQWQDVEPLLSKYFDDRFLVITAAQ